VIYGSLKEPSMNKFGQVTHYSTIIAAAATITMSVAGYWSFEEKTLSNVLVSLAQTTALPSVVS
jgi:sodium-coupled neutral amino acid transporter 11